MFTILSFGMCAALLPHQPNIDIPNLVGIGLLKDQSCEMFFIGSSSAGEIVPMQGHDVEIQDWEAGMIVIVDGERFFVRRAVDL